MNENNHSVKRCTQSLQNLLEIQVRTVLCIHPHYRSEFWLTVLPSVRLGNPSSTIKSPRIPSPISHSLKNSIKNDKSEVVTLFIRSSDKKHQTQNWFAVDFFLELSLYSCKPTTILQSSRASQPFLRVATIPKRYSVFFFSALVSKVLKQTAYFRRALDSKCDEKHKALLPTATTGGSFRKQLTKVHH